MSIRSVLRPWYHKMTRSRLFVSRPLPHTIEKMLIEGQHQTSSLQPSILHFSLNKAATQSVKSILQQIAQKNNLISVQMNEMAFNSNLPYMDQLDAIAFQPYQKVFQPVGYLYSAFGGLVPYIHQLERYKIVFMVRDPRDILVSTYFSMAYSHPEPSIDSNKRNAFLALKKNVQNTDINDWVLEWAPTLKINIEKYVKELLPRFPDLPIFKFEDMAHDFEVWLKQLTDHIECSLSEKSRQNLILHNLQKIPRKEQVSQHVRKGRHGDYEEKLNRQTIEALNLQFSEEMKLFGYLV